MRIRSRLPVLLNCKNPVLLLPVYRALTARGSVWALAVHAAQVYCLALEMAFLATHIARVGSHAVSGSVSKPSAFKTCHRSASLFESRHHDRTSTKRYTVQP